MARKNSDGAKTATILDVMEITNVLNGKSFSITGHLGLPRNEVVAIIQRAGGVFHKSPSYSTNYLVTNRDWNCDSTIADGTSRKLEAARRNGTVIISEQQLFDMIVKLSESKQQI